MVAPEPDAEAVHLPGEEIGDAGQPVAERPDGREPVQLPMLVT